MKILHLLSQRPDSTGSGIYVQAMLREAAARGHRNRLLAGIEADRQPALKAVPPEACSFVCFSGPDLAFPIAGMSDVMPYESRRFCDLSPAEVDDYERCFSEKLKPLVAGFQPDIIHSHHLWLLTSLTRRLFPDIPMVTTCHGTDLRQFHNCPHLRERVLSGCRDLDAVMALSQAQKKDIADLYYLPPEKIFVVGAGYDQALFAPAEKPAPPPVHILYAGKLCRAKGLPWLLHALAGMKIPDWQLHLAGGGGGPEKDHCLELARRLGDRATVYGAIDQIRLAGLMKQSHIFVLSSFFEGLPLVVLEALACGCRIVATDLPGVKEVVKDMPVDYIRLVKTPRLQALDQPHAEDEDPFEAALALALAEQTASAARRPDIDLSPIKQQIASFSWEKVFERVEAVYFKAVNPF